MPPLPPPRWTSEELEEDRLTAIEVFRHERMHEPLEQYSWAFDDYRRTIEELLEKTADLRRLGAVAVDVLTDPALLEAVRYLAGPPISAEAQVWQSEFGTAGVVPAAVLSGVFERSHLEYAQDRGLTIFWSHSLNRLTEWIRQTRGADDTRDKVSPRRGR